MRIRFGVLILFVLLPAPAPAQDDAAARLLANAAEARTKGSESATVLVYEITDFQCPYCARFAIDVFPQIDSAYIQTGRVQWVFVNLPMPSHARAWIAAEAALCAGAVAGSFWPMHDSLFAHASEWIDAPDAAAAAALFERYARNAGVPTAAYRECVAGDMVAPLILQDVIFGSRVTGTPTFLVNNEKTIVGVRPFEEWRDVLEEALREKR